MVCSQELDTGAIVTLALDLLQKCLTVCVFLWFVCVFSRGEIQRMQPVKACSSTLSITRFFSIIRFHIIKSVESEKY